MDAHARLLASSPTALATLLAIFEKARDFPTLRKYRQFKVSATVEREVLSKDGARSLLAAVGYARDGDCMALASPDAPVTLGRLRAAIAALRAVARSAEHERAVKAAALPSERARAEHAARAARRARFKREAPPEPERGEHDGGVCVVRFADAAGDVRATRRFRADDTFADVLAFARGEDALSAWSDRAPLDGSDDDAPLAARDITTRREPPPVLTATADGGRTLQALGFWPSARLELTSIDGADRAVVATAPAAAAAALSATRPKPSAVLGLSRDSARFAEATSGPRQHHRVHGARAAALRAAEARRAQEKRDALLAMRLQQDEEDELRRRGRHYQREVDARA